MNITTRTLCIAMLVFGLTACKGGCQKNAADQTTPTPAGQDQSAGTPTPTTPGTAELTPEQIADSLSKAVCGRIVACNQEAGTSATDCAAGMTKDLAQALPDKAKTVTKTSLDGCVAAISSASCDDLNSPAPPKGCEFME